MLAKVKSGGEAAGRKNYRAQLVVERLTGQRDLARLAYTLETKNFVEEVGFIEHLSLEA